MRRTLSRSKATLPAWALAPATTGGQKRAAASEVPVGPLPWRQKLPRWPDPWRQRWGERANSLEALGLDWREAERQAFDEVLLAKQEADT